MDFFSSPKRFVPGIRSRRISTFHFLSGAGGRKGIGKCGVLLHFPNQLAAEIVVQTHEHEPACRRYLNNGMLLRLPNGLTVESVLTRKKFPKWQDAHLEFPRIVFQGKQAVQTLRRKAPDSGKCANGVQKVCSSFPA